MNDDITPTLQAKSDQLNAADLMGGPATLTVIEVTVSKSSDQPVTIKVDGGFQPYKPCKSMRRLLAQIWGTSSKQWIGEMFTLYCDPEVLWAGQAVGGIRVSHVTGIDSPREVHLRAAKTKVITYTIHPIALPKYKDSDIETNSPEWATLFGEKKSSPDKLISMIKKKFTLTAEQEGVIRNISYCDDQQRQN